jgi:hypothetical protein
MVHGAHRNRMTKTRCPCAATAVGVVRKHLWFQPVPSSPTAIPAGYSCFCLGFLISNITVTAASVVSSNAARRPSQQAPQLTILMEPPAPPAEYDTTRRAYNEFPDLPHQHTQERDEEVAPQELRRARGMPHGYHHTPQSKSRPIIRCAVYPCRLPCPYPYPLSCLPHRCQRPCQLLHRESTCSLASH